MSNHLIAEKSPYLLQHANNPVDWYPWGQEAFDKARREDKPIFLSIGYSTCHWCHVMERESFENDEIARLLNSSFVPIKVDREERPDVDRIYMTYVQATTGSGGWPMSVFLTPDLKPFFGGTYFPPDNRYQRPGFATVLERLAEAWKKDRERIVQSSSEVVTQLAGHLAQASPNGHVLDRTIFDSAFQYFRRTFDSTHGGFGDAPKFPRPVALNFLFRYHARFDRSEAHEMALATLRAMAEGGMHDQLGGGFHRYSVDSHWFVPHFEKMLYDQAQLASSYLEAFQISHDPFFSNVARSTLDYVLRDMTHPEGGFYSAEDADSVIDPADPNVKGEGAYYVWTSEELKALLGEQLFNTFAFRYGVDPYGNVRDDPHREFVGKNILYTRHTVAQTAENFHIKESTAKAELEKAMARVLEARSRRIRPHLDDKILTAWNGLMISAFAKAAQVLNEPRYFEAARKATEFILSRMYRSDQTTLLRRYRDGDAAIDGFLDDYAFFIAALIDLYETDFNLRHLELAMGLTDQMRDLFEDPVDGGFFSTAEGDNSLVLRMKDDYDGAEPSGNSIAILDLLRLAHFTNRSSYREAAERALRAFSSKIATQPVAIPQMLVALDYSQAVPSEVVIAGDPNADLTRAFLLNLRGRFLPHTITLLLDSDDTRTKLAAFFPAAAEMRELHGKPTAYVCDNFACRLPVNEISKFDELLQ